MARVKRDPDARADRRLAERLDALLARLEADDVYVATAADENGKTLLHLRGDGRQRPRTVDSGLFAYCCQQGLLEKLGNDRWRISDPGRAWRLRRRAPDAPFLAQHADLQNTVIDVDGVRRPAMVNASESPLAWLFRRKGSNGTKLVSAEQFAAGERLRRDFTKAHLMPSTTSRWDAALGRDKQRKGPPGLTLIESALVARQQVERAIASVGPELSGVLVDVCCFLKGLEDVERSNSWPARSAKLVLSLGLTRLARHYGLLAPADARRQVLRHWGSDDYRPEV